MNAYTAQDQLVWKKLFERQLKNLPGKVCQEYLDALENMSEVLNADSIPDFSKIDNWFSTATGWKIEVVPGLIPVEDFFALLAEKKFCSSTWLRNMDQLDYLEEPDMFHDTFGHIPLLSNPVFSDFMQQFGILGCQLTDNDQLLALQRLYWFTIEFGMIGEGEKLIYGAGIISSFGESNRVMSGIADLIDFTIDDVLNKPFRTDAIQEEYICIDNFKTLLSSIQILENKWLTIGV